MKRYFFDVLVKSTVRFDFRGRDLERIDQVREIAELIALDIECTDGEELVAVEVQVRNIGGQKLFSVPVQLPSLIAA